MSSLSNSSILAHSSISNSPWQQEKSLFPSCFPYRNLAWRHLRGTLSAQGNALMMGEETW